MLLSNSLCSQQSSNVETVETDICSLPAWLQRLSQLSLCSPTPGAIWAGQEMGLHWVIAVQMVLVLSRLVLCSLTSRSGSLSMLRAPELMCPHPSISCSGAAKGLGCVPCLPGLSLGWGTCSCWPIPWGV